MMKNCCGITIFTTQKFTIIQVLIVINFTTLKKSENLSLFSFFFSRLAACSFPILVYFSLLFSLCFKVLNNSQLNEKSQKRAKTSFVCEEVELWKYSARFMSKNFHEKLFFNKLFLTLNKEKKKKHKKSHKKWAFEERDFWALEKFLSLFVGE